MKKTRFALGLAMSAVFGCSAINQDPAAESPAAADTEVIAQEVTESATLIVNEGFGTSTGGFTYADDQFRGTAQPSYASGTRVTTGGISAGTLRVDLGGKDNVQVLGMSGGWSKSFNLSTPARV